MTLFLLVLGSIIAPLSNLVGTIILARGIAINPGRAHQGTADDPLYLAVVRNPRSVRYGILLNIMGFVVGAVVAIANSYLTTQEWRE